MTNPTDVQTLTIELRFVLKPDDDGALLSRAVVESASMLARLAGIEWGGGEQRLADGRPSPEKPT